MNIYIKILLVLLGLAYLISPADIFPEFVIPYLGWLDDGLVLYSIFHLIRYGDLPWFLFRRKPPRHPGNKSPGKKGPGRSGPTVSGQARRQAPGKKQEAPRSGGQPRTPPHGEQNAPLSDAPPLTPHEILGVSSGASREEIQKAYKAAIKKYHPDKVSHLGKEFSDLANEKFLAIQKAYDTLKAQKRRGQ